MRPDPPTYESAATVMSAEGRVNYSDDESAYWTIRPTDSVPYSSILTLSWTATGSADDLVEAADKFLGSPPDDSLGMVQLRVPQKPGIASYYDRGHEIVRICKANIDAVEFYRMDYPAAEIAVIWTPVGEEDGPDYATKEVTVMFTPGSLSVAHEALNATATPLVKQGAPRILSSLAIGDRDVRYAQRLNESGPQWGSHVDAPSTAQANIS